MVSVHIWFSIYTNNAILCIIWKFDLSSRGVLGRIYALGIEVLIYAWWRTTQQNILKKFCQNIRNKIAVKANFHFSHYKSMETLFP